MADSLEDYSPEQLAEMGRLYSELVKNPNTRELTLRATKKVAPGTPIPEIDVVDRVSALAKPHIDKLESMEKAQLEREVNERIKEQRAALKEAGHSKEDIDAIEKLMVEKKIPDHASAAEFYTMQNTLATPTTPTWKPSIPKFDKEKVKAAGGWKNYFRDEAHAAIDELRAGKLKNLH